ncbi:MAG TPA: transglutaminase-like domain-containing protein [Pseudobacteroides sp.]|uniref:transglutaminase-like domain-containing protein n=1 Tax=Pseudobacteroides sp. TaxID=1968840 RepID=UPI002F94CE77
MKDKILELKESLFPLMFSVSLTLWTVDSIFGANVILTLLISLVVNSMLFMALSNLKEKGSSGGLLFILGSLVYFSAAILILMSTGYSQGGRFLGWLLSQSDNGVMIPGYWIGTLLISAYMFSTTVYYFTAVSFRIWVLFLVGFIPFLFYSAKSDKEISIPFLMFAVFFFSLCVERARNKTVNKARFEFIRNPSYIAAMFLFLLLTTVFAIIAPKPYTVPQIVYLDAIISQTIQPFGSAMQNAIQNQNNFRLFNPMSLKKESFITSAGVPVGNRVLFEVEADEPLYLRVQSWDKYENNRWSIGDEYMENEESFEFYSNKQGYINSFTALLNYYENKPKVPAELKVFDDVYNYRSSPMEEKKAVITPKTAFSSSYLTPPGVVSVTNNRKSYYTFSILENLICKSRNRPLLDDAYTVSYISHNMLPATREFQAVKLLKEDIVESLVKKDNLNIIVKDSKENTDLLVKLLYSADDYNAASRYYTGLPDNMPERVYNLAEKITKGKNSDYLKALAIQNYFHSSGYKYSLKPPRISRNMDYNDFFLFESKKGVCVQFASSMVILARAAGLPARYVEGYVARELDPVTGKYMVRDKHAHAFPEVFIAGYGWMVFEPTVSAEDTTEEIIAFFKGVGESIGAFISFFIGFFTGLPMWFKIFSIPLGLMSVIAAIRVFILFRKIMWKRRISRSSCKDSLEGIFGRITCLLAKAGMGIKSYETPSIYSIRVSQEAGLDIGNISEVFNRSRYGGINPTKDDIRMAMEIFNEIEKDVKRRIGFIRSILI